MSAYIWSRLATLVPVLLLISIFVFSIMHLLPGDPAMLVLAGEYATTPEQIETLREQLGLNDPIYTQYGRFLGNALQGDLGNSVHFKRPVSEVILERLPSTLQLTVVAMLIAAALGIGLGTLAAVHHGSWLDNFSMVLSLVGVSMPIFFIGLLLILIFGVRLGWFPIVGGTPLERLVLPALTLGFASSSVIARLVRSSLLEVLRQDYMVTAYAKGLTSWLVLFRHGMRNTLIPVVTILGLQIGGMLSGAVLIETVFSRPGLGRLAVEAILWKDFPLAQGTILFTAVVYVVASLIVDIVYASLDPRIRY
jgi:ABC-type dipeptide/oligopeptide/nickel transport system permease component